MAIFLVEEAPALSSPIIADEYFAQIKSILLSRRLKKQL